jgi:phosphoenolpyruvate carboxykinase (ATP)
VFLMNTGRVGGREDDDRSKKVKIPHSGAIVEAIAEGTITWTEDDDFGYQIAESVPGIDDRELLRPRRLYERQGRMDEYRKFVERFKTERREFLEGFPGLDPEIIKAVL